MKTRLCLLVAAVAAILNAHAWDISGHMIVAKIAHDRLNPKAAARLEALAPQLQFNTSHYNSVNVAAWADNIKHLHGGPFAGQFKNWHFIDLGCEASDPDLIADPPKMSIQNGDVVSALKRCVAVVKGGHDPFITNEVIAVALIVHLVGDIHQPLHCTTDYYLQPHVEPGHKRPQMHDAGGNAVLVSNFKDKYPNLHEFWDVGYKVKRALLIGTITSAPDLDTFATTPTDAAIRAAAADISKFPPLASVNMHADFEQWARETHALGCASGYGNLKKYVEGKPVKLGAAYVKNARQVASQQLCLAGFRLASLLNELYPEH